MMKSLLPGIEYTLHYVVLDKRTVPKLLPESEEFRAMPEVLATGYMVGLVEWACIRAINPHLNWPDEQTVGIHVDLSHTAATSPGMEVEIRVRLTEVSGKKLTFDVEARDNLDPICSGTHERYVIDFKRFSEKAAKKAQTLANSAID